MTITDMTRSRVDLFTDIHKGLRKALFDVATQAGATDWADAQSLGALDASWRPLVELLRCHTEHESNHIFRLLDGTNNAAVAPDDHRDLNRYIAATLEHLHVEETVVLPALWAVRSDDELITCRATFLAATPPTVLQTTMRLLRSALPLATQRAMGLA